MTTEVRLLLTAQDAAFRVGDMTALRSARSVLSKGIKAASGTYAEKIQGHTRWMWQGVQALRDYKSSQGVNDNDASLPDRLNNFFAQFEAPNPITRGRAVPSPPSIRPALTINAADTHRTLTSVNPRKAGGTASPQGCVLSPLLFTLLTHDCASRHERSQIIKFADLDMVLQLQYVRQKRPADNSERS